MRFLTETVVPGHGLLAAVAALGCASGLLAETHTVDDDGPADFSTIQAAIDAASDGDEILVAPGVYTADSGRAVADVRQKELVLWSTSGPEVTILAAGESQWALVCDGALDAWGVVKISGFTLRPDRPGDGESDASDPSALGSWATDVVMRNCIVENFEAPSATISVWGDRSPLGALLLASLDIEDCSFENNASCTFEFEIGTITGCTFEHNTNCYMESGQAAYVNFEDCTFTANSSLGLRCAGPTHEDSEWDDTLPFPQMVISNCRFTENDLRISYATAIGFVEDCEFIGNVSPGGHIHAGISSDVRVERCSFIDFVGRGVNSNEAFLGVGDCTFRPRPETESRCFMVAGVADFNGLLNPPSEEGVWTSGFWDCVFEGGSGVEGGAGLVASDSLAYAEYLQRVFFTRCTFIDNRSSGNGGALMIENASVELFECDFINNACSGSGNAIHVEIDESTMSDDTADLEIPLWITGSSFKDNDGSPEYLGAYTVFNDGVEAARCVDSNFCGSRIGHFGGDAIYDWGNLFADDCWENFPNPHGISFVSELDPWIWATVHSNGEMLQDFANAGPGDNAWATIDSPSHPSWAHAEAVGVVSDFQRLHNGMSYQLRTWGDLDAWSKNAGERMSCDADVYSDTLLVVKTEAVQVLDILMASGGAAEDHREWQNQAMFVEVRDTATMNPIAPVIEAYSDGWWRYELPADGEYWILTYVEVLSEISVEHDSNDPAGTRMTRAYEETYDVQMLFHIKGDVNGDGIVDGADLAALLGSWGTQNPDHDLNGDGEVDGGDLAMMLGSWGTP